MHHAIIYTRDAGIIDSRTRTIVTPIAPRSRGVQDLSDRWEQRRPSTGGPGSNDSSRTNHSGPLQAPAVGDAAQGLAPPSETSGMDASVVEPSNLPGDIPEASSSPALARNASPPHAAGVADPEQPPPAAAGVASPEHPPRAGSGVPSPDQPPLGATGDGSPEQPPAAGDVPSASQFPPDDAPARRNLQGNAIQSS